jgi:hypothetical protein
LGQRGEGTREERGRERRGAREELEGSREERGLERR